MIGLNLISVTGINLYQLMDMESNNYEAWSPSGLCVRSTPLLIYINVLNSAIKYCRVQHFADDTNLLISI